MGSIKGSRFVLAKSGEKYLVFGNGNDRMTLPIASHNKEFTGHWLDPNTGDAVREIRVAKGLDFDETPPSTEENLLWLECR